MGKLRARGEDPDGVGRSLQQMVLQMERDMDEEIREIGDEAELLYAAAALKSTGRMARNVKAHHLGGSVVHVDVHARDPKTGYDYVGVTRFGHTVARITPSEARRPASVISTRRRRARVHYLTGPRPALRLPSGEFRYSVRGFHPSGDWALKAWPAVKAAGEAHAHKLGAKILARFG